MNLNANGFQIRLYQWFYQTNQLPTNFCPYFWKLVLLYVLLLPYTIAVLPYHGLNKLSGNSHRDDIPAIGAFFIGSLVYLAMFMTVSLILVWFTESKVVLGFAASGYFLVGAAIFIWSKDKIEDWNSDRRFKKRQAKIDAGVDPDQSNMVVTFAKSWYEKHCPRINWDSKT